MLLSGRATADHAIDPLSRKDEAYRTVRDFRSHGRKNLMLPQAFAAENTAYEGRGNDHLVFGHAEHLPDRPGGMCNQLQGIVDGQNIALPRGVYTLKFDRIVVVARRQIRGVDLHFGLGRGWLGIAAPVLKGLAHEHCGPNTLPACAGEKGHVVISSQNTRSATDPRIWITNGHGEWDAYLAESFNADDAAPLDREGESPSEAEAYLGISPSDEVWASFSRHGGKLGKGSRITAARIQE